MGYARARGAQRGLLMSMLLAFPFHVTAQVESPASGGERLVTPTHASLDSPAQAALRQLAKPSADTQPLRVANAEKAHPDLVTRLEEIRIYGRNEPEDYVGRRLSPLMQFRARLERDVPMTPAKKLQLAFCIIGLCGIYGPEGIPLGDSPEIRAEARLLQTTTQLNAQFRGTLQ